MYKFSTNSNIYVCYREYYMSLNKQDTKNVFQKYVQNLIAIAVTLNLVLHNDTIVKCTLNGTKMLF